VRVGDAVKSFTLEAVPKTVQLAFAVKRPGDTIVFEIPHAASPASRGDSADRRQLGFRLQKLRIVAIER
jgi:hypothetical protein